MITFRISHFSHFCISHFLVFLYMLNFGGGILRNEHMVQNESVIPILNFSPQNFDFWAGGAR